MLRFSKHSEHFFSNLLVNQKPGTRNFSFANHFLRMLPAVQRLSS
jgi:hypothetical protein